MLLLRATQYAVFRSCQFPAHPILRDLSRISLEFGSDAAATARRHSGSGTRNVLIAAS